MSTQFIGEPLSGIVVGLPSSTGEPVAPSEFSWRNQTYQVVEIIDKHKGIDRDRTHGSSEQYVHKHWFTVKVNDGRIMSIYFERQPRGRGTQRWWLYQVE